MPEKALFLIGTTPQPPGTGAGLADQVLRHLNQPQGPRVAAHTLTEVVADPALLDGCAVAWLHADQPKPAGLYDLVALLQDRHLPGMLTRPGDVTPLGAAAMDGLVAAPPQSEPAAIAAVLRALWTQADGVRALKMELALLQLHHGGMVDQFDKIDEELRLAAQLQRDFLPARMPHWPGIELDVLFRPAGYVSGDIYDVRQLNEDHVGFFLADAVGHGVPAALLTAYIKSSLTTRQVDHSGHLNRIVPPHQTLAQLNRDILRSQVEQVRTATAVYGVLNLRTRVLQLARAGHPYPLLMRPDGSTRDLTPEGAILGVFPDETFESIEVLMRPGDRLLFYSDGFEIAFPEPSGTPSNVRKGPARRRRLLANDQYLDEFRDLANGSVQDALRRLADKLDHQTGSLNQSDDLTVLLLGIRADADEHGLDGPAISIAGLDDTPALPLAALR